MKKLFKRIIQWFKGIRYFIQYTMESVDQSISKDRRALKIAIKYPISQEDARQLIDVADGLGISDQTVEKLVHHSALFGFDRLNFPLEIMCTFKIELSRRGIKT